MSVKKQPTPKEKRGPKPATVKVTGDWESAVSDALKKEKPAQGWPPPDKKKKF